MKNTFFMLVATMILSAQAMGQSGNLNLVDDWYEYLISKNTNTSEKPVAISELIWYRSDANGNITNQIVGPVASDPISASNVNLVSKFVSMLVSYKKEDIAITRKKEAVDSKLATITSLVVDKAVGKLILKSGNTALVSMNIEEKGGLCIGKFNLDGVSYLVSLNMKKGRLDAQGKLIFI